MLCVILEELTTALRWCNNEWDGISNHWRFHCLLTCWFRCRSKETSKLHITGHCEGNSPVTGEFPTQRPSHTENVSIWWRHHGLTAGAVVGFNDFDCIFVDHIRFFKMSNDFLQTVMALWDMKRKNLMRLSYHGIIPCNFGWPYWLIHTNTLPSVSRLSVALFSELGNEVWWCFIMK